MENVVFERFTRAIGKQAASIAPERIREPAAGGFQMALQADLEASFGREPRRIDNRRSHSRGRSASARLGDMLPSGPVTSLAIDTLGNSPAQKQFTVGGGAGGPALGIGVVAEETLLVDRALKAGMIAAI